MSIKKSPGLAHYVDLSGYTETLNGIDAEEVLKTNVSLDIPFRRFIFNFDPNKTYGYNFIKRVFQSVMPEGHIDMVFLFNTNSKIDVTCAEALSKLKVKPKRFMAKGAHSSRDTKSGISNQETYTVTDADLFEAFADM